MVHEDARERVGERVGAGACLAEDVVFRFVSRQIPSSGLEAIEGHLAVCGDCRGLVAELARPADGDPHEETETVVVRDDRVAVDGEGTGTSPARLPESGDTVGRYLVSRPIGMGGMGVVFLATDPTLNRRVTIKLLRTERQAQRSAQRELLREAQSMAKLAHPNVVSVYDAGTFDDQVFMAMEFVEGSTLREWLAVEPRPWRDVLAVFMDAGRGLVAAHAEGIIHRDFKPSNVLVGKDGRARVTDFGLARAVAVDDGTEGASANAPSAVVGAEEEGVSMTHTRTGTMKGTPGYMAPEQFEGRRLDARVDQFSFCVALYEGFYGENPFDGRDVRERSISVRSGAFRMPPTDDRIPKGLRDCVLRGLAADPGARHESMAELLVALDEESAGSTRRGARRSFPSRRFGVRIALGALVGSSLVASAIGFSRMRSGASAPASASAVAIEPGPPPALEIQPALPIAPSASALARQTSSEAPRSAPAAPKKGARRPHVAASNAAAPKPSASVRYNDSMMEPSFARKK